MRKIVHKLFLSTARVAFTTIGAAVLVAVACIWFPHGPAGDYFALVFGGFLLGQGFLLWAIKDEAWPHMAWVKWLLFVFFAALGLAPLDSQGGDVSVRLADLLYLLSVGVTAFLDWLPKRGLFQPNSV